MDRYESYYVSEAGGIYVTKAEAMEATDDYETCWAYTDSADVQGLID